MKKIISFFTLMSIVLSSFVVVNTQEVLAADSNLATNPLYVAISPSTATDVTMTWTVGLQTGNGSIATSSQARFKVKNNSGTQIGTAVLACAASTTVIAGAGVTQAYGNGSATFTFSSSTANTAASVCIKVPALVAGVYYVTLYTGVPANDSAAVALYVGTSNQVTVSADVDPTFSFTLSSNSCDLGVLTTAATSSCSYSATSSANTAISNGIIIKVKSNNAYLESATADQIPGIGGKANFGVGVAGNGMRLSTSTVGASIGTGFDGTANQGTSVPTTDEPVLTSSGQTSISFTAQHLAIAASDTKVGHYTQQVTYTATLAF